MKRFTITLAALLVALLVSDADAQRRRRRRRPPPPPEEQTEPETPPAEEAPPAEADQAPEEPPPEIEEAPPEPEPTEEPPPAEEPLAELPDLSPLRTDFEALMDELVQARSRIAVLGNQLFQTKVRIRIENRAGDQVLSELAIRLDGAPVFRADGDVGDDARQVFEGFAAPGPHDVTLELEQRARADDAYRYVQRDTFRFQVVQGKLTELIIRLDDDSDIAEDFEDDGEGEYDVQVRVRVATRDLESEN